MTLTAQVRRRRIVLIAGVLLLVGVGWAFRHVTSTLASLHGNGPQYGFIFTAAFLMLVFQMGLCFFESTPKIDIYQRLKLDRLRVCAQIPVHNEDPGALMEDILSILRQTRPVQVIDVVENGINEIDYAETERWFYRTLTEHGAVGTWRRTPDKGKRKAQAVTVREMRGHVDLYLTVDSDAVLAPNAVEELIKAFADPRVFSAAGIVLALNNRSRHFGKNLLCRMTDLWFVTGQLVDRSSQSAMGSVLVNSGVLAMYRAAILEDNLEGYLNEVTPVGGRAVEFSDDSLLTIYALKRGRAVQIPTSFAFTLMPETLDHHLRQYVRWMRGAFIRTWWRFRYLPLSGYAFWAHFIGWCQMGISTFIFVNIFIGRALGGVSFVDYAALFAIPVLVGYLQSLRYLSFSRSDESLLSQIGTWCLSPLASLWSFTVLRIVRWYAMATFLRTGWGTRGSVEVGLAAPA